jgi:AIPR protein
MASLPFAKSVPASFPHTYRFRVPQELVRSITDPHDREITIHHVWIPVAEFKREMLPDDINPRAHEEMSGRIPQVIERSLIENPTEFHLLNRGELILAESCRYDNHNKTLEITISSKEDGGLADGGTTDRVLARAEEAAKRRHSPFTEDEVAESLKTAYVHVEVISGNVREKLVRLAGARNTSNQVKEFALENLGGGFDWLKKVIESSSLAGRVRYRENDPEDVDIRTVLALLTMFHPQWTEEGRDPLIAYTSKGGILKYYRDPDWLPGYQALSPVVVEILQLCDYIHEQFAAQYQAYNLEANDSKSKFGRRREVLYKGGASFKLPLTGTEVKYFVSDGWLYPVLGSLRMLLKWQKDKPVKWATDPFKYFDEHGSELVGIVVEQSQALGYNPNAVGKSRPLWSNLRKTVELERMKLDQSS